MTSVSWACEHHTWVAYIQRLLKIVSLKCLMIGRSLNISMILFYSFCSEHLWWISNPIWSASPFSMNRFRWRKQKLRQCVSMFICIYIYTYIYIYMESTWLQIYRMRQTNNKSWKTPFIDSSICLSYERDLWYHNTEQKFVISCCHYPHDTQNWLHMVMVFCYQSYISPGFCVVACIL